MHAGIIAYELEIEKALPLKQSKIQIFFEEQKTCIALGHSC